jgi:hypothetical protein
MDGGTWKGKFALLVTLTSLAAGPGMVHIGVLKPHAKCKVRRYLLQSDACSVVRRAVSIFLGLFLPLAMIGGLLKEGCTGNARIGCQCLWVGGVVSTRSPSCPKVQAIPSRLRPACAWKAALAARYRSFIAPPAPCDANNVRT